MTNKGLVLVEYEYKYIGRDSELISIKPHERYILLSKTNDHWWHVRKDDQARPFYIPAKYVKELPAHVPSPLDFIDAPQPAATDLKADKRPIDTPDRHEITIRVRSPNNSRKTENRMSTFGIPLDVQSLDYRRGGSVDSVLSLHSSGPVNSASSKNVPQHGKRVDPRAALERQLHADERLQLSITPRVPSFSPADPQARPTKLKPVDLPTIKGIKSSPQVQETADRSELSVDGEELDIFHSKQPVDSENIYESIQDVSLQPKELSLSGVGPVPSPQPATTQAPAAPTSPQIENDRPATAVYTNINELKKNIPHVSPPSLSNSSRTGQTSLIGPSTPLKEQLPSDILLLPPALSPTLSPPAPTADASVFKLESDASAGQDSIHSPMSPLVGTVWVPTKVVETQGQQTAQDNGPPPLPKEDYPEDNSETWDPQPLAFPKDYSPPSLQQMGIPRACVDPGSLPGARHTQLLGPPSQPKTGFTVEEGVSVMMNWRHSLSPSHFSAMQDDATFMPTHKRKTSDSSNEVFSSVSSLETHHHHHHHHHHTNVFEKAGIVNKTKISDSGKRLRKNWAQSWTVLHGGILTFHKDPRFTPGVTSSKTNQIVPEYTVELRGATIGWASKEKSSKKNVLELRSRNGSEYLIQYDTDSIIVDWYNILADTIRHLDGDHHHDQEEAEEYSEKPPGRTDKEDKRKIGARQSTPSFSSESEQGRVRNKLRKFLQRRPTLQSVKEKGYIKENVFGCDLETLCQRENSTYPSFVEKCITSVEKRGLETDGIYRVSGNLAVIQKLRYKVDHEDNLDLDDGQWEEIHVIAGALKLFFRELPEPLFPFSHFSNFIAAIKLTDHNQKMATVCDLVKSLPSSNHDTMELLFRHLQKVIKFGDKNRMSAQSVAIVFGPTLLRPETESANITMYMVYQTQIVEFMLNELDKIFPPG